MSVWRRLGNVAKGKVLSWQRSQPATDEDLLEAEVQPRGEPEPDVDVPEPTPVEAPKGPRKRRL